MSHAHTHSLRENTGIITGIAAVAAGIGAVTAMLVTPRTGQEVRGELKRRTSAVKEAVTHKSEHGKDVAQDLASDAKSEAEDKVAEAKAQAKKADPK